MTTTSRRRQIGAATLIVGTAFLAVLLDLAHQPSDPVRDLSVSIGVLDEGIWSHNAVNDELFGRARLDDFNPMYVSAGSALYRASYAIFGVGIRQTRLPSILFAAVTVLVVGLLVWREDPLAGVVAAVLLGTSWLFLSYSRLGLLETPAAGIALCGLSCLVLALADRPRLALGLPAGVLIAVAVAVKPQVAGAVVGAAMGLIVWGALDRGKRRGRTLLAAAAGFVFAGAAWAAFVAAHLDPSIRSEWRWHSSGILPRLGDILTNVRTYAGSSDGFGTRARPLLIAAGAGLVLQLLAWLMRKQRPGPLAFAGAGWAAGAVGVIAALPYTPSRYAMLAMPGLAITAGCGMTAARVLFAPRAAVMMRAGAAALAVVAAAVSLGAWANWAREPEFGLRRTAATLRRETRPGDVIYGGWALLPGIDAHRRVIVSHTPHINDRCPIERFGAKWALVNSSDPAERAHFADSYPGLAMPANEVARARILGRRLILYRVPPELKGTGCG